MALLPCPACQRHVFTTETTCPFCRSELDALDASALRRVPAGRMSRAALVVLGMTSVACSGDTEESGNSGGDTATTVTSGMNTSTQSSATNSATTMANAVNTSAGGTATVGGVPVYGAPPTGDAFGVGGTVSGGNGGVGGTGGTGGTGSTDSGTGGAAGEAGAGGSSSVPGTGGGGAIPLYGAPPTPGD